MATKFVFAIVVLCAVSVKSDKRSYRTPDNVRIKRMKYYSSPPVKFFRLPPPPQFVKGVFSYTPPPNFMEEDDPPYSGNFRPSKYSKHPSNDGLPDKDINNIVNHLSKQDLNKIIEFAGEKYRPPSFENYKVDNIIYKPNVRDSEQPFSLNGPYIKTYENHTKHDADYSDASKHVAKVANMENSSELSAYKGPNTPGFSASRPIYVEENIPTRYSNPPQTFENNLKNISWVLLDTQEHKKNSQFSFIDSYIQQELNNSPGKATRNEFTENKAMQEEQLPKPVNLREEDNYIASNTNNVPSIVKANSYKYENFGNLPLMEYNSKLHTVSSYYVPHYSVLSQASQPSRFVSTPSASNVESPKLELAPPRSAAKEQSDAHLKAIKIWTHHSKGTAYTLHDDGTLSLERVTQPKPGYY